MRFGGWLLGVTGAVCMTWISATASAQTVIIRHVGGQTKVDAGVGDSAPVAATTDAYGNERVVLNAVKGDTQLSAQIVIDACGNARHVRIIGSQMTAPPAAAGCVRQTLGSVFVVGATTSLVVDLRSETPTVLIAQGPAPPEWLEDQSQGAPGVAGTFQPSGIMLFGTGGLTTFGSFGSADCGQNTTTCSYHSNRPSATAGAAWWFTPHVAVVVSYMRNGAARASGTGDTYTFNSRLETNVLTVGGQIMGSVRHVTFFGLLGGAHHRARWLTSQTTNDTTVTVNGVDQILPGGTETWDVRTTGWNWSLSAGADFWLGSRVAIQTAFQFAVLKGSDLGGSEATISERTPSVQVGLLFRLGG
jgi:hypothetical protein